MPFYEYECEDCRTVFDELRRTDEREDPIACPECGGKGRVIVSGFASSSGSHGDGGACHPGST